MIVSLYMLFSVSVNWFHWCAQNTMHEKSTIKWNNNANSCNFELGESNGFLASHSALGKRHIRFGALVNCTRTRTWQMVNNNSWHRHPNTDIWGAYYHHKRICARARRLPLISLTFVFISQWFLSLIYCSFSFPCGTQSMPMWLLYVLCMRVSFESICFIHFGNNKTQVKRTII